MSGEWGQRFCCTVFNVFLFYRHWDISSSERLAIVKDYVNYGLEHWGSDTQVRRTIISYRVSWFMIYYYY